MYTKKEFQSQSDLYSYLKSNNDVYFLGEFLREIDEKTDELIIIIRTNHLIDLNNVPLIMHTKSKRKILTTHVQSWEKLLNFWDIFYWAYVFQNEIYDFYGKETLWFQHHTSRLHFFADNFFPYRLIGKPDIQIKNKFVFPNIEWEWLICVPVGPVHAGIIPPWHFRFLVDGENTCDLEIQLGWKTRLIDRYFMSETSLSALMEASWEIVWDSVIAYSLGYVKNIEDATKIKISTLSMATRIVMLEIERIYNHLWTIWALWNDVWQSYILNWFLAIREKILNINKDIFWQRSMKWNIQIWGNHIELDEKSMSKIQTNLHEILPRIQNLVNIMKFSSGIYDRFKDAGIISKEIALKHNALWIAAKASMISIDARITDPYYIKLWIENIHITLWENWDCFDRLIVRAEEIYTSIEIIDTIASQFQKKSFTHQKTEKQKLWEKNIQLTDGYFVSNIEWHRGEILQIMQVEKWKINYYKHKDPSFVNWALLEYSVLDNIIADFPICNKSFDLSYSWFDM